MNEINLAPGKFHQLDYIIKGITALSLIPLILAFSTFYAVFQITYYHAHKKFRSVQD